MLCMRGIDARACTAFLWLLTAGAAPAADADQTSAAALKQLSLEQLSEIEVISPSKEPEQTIRVPAAIYVITSDDIRRSGATSLPEVLRLAPGVEVARIEGNKWSVGIRGFGSRLSRSVLVLIDGRSVYTTFFAGTYWEVQDTVLEDIDHIEIIRGPGGTIWGPNAVNGVINIITKDTKDTHGMLVTTRSGSEDYGDVEFRYGGGNGRNLNYRIYGKGFTRGPEHHQDGRNYDDWRAARTGFRIDWDRGPRDQLTFSGDLYTEEAGERVTVTSYTAPFSQNVEANADLSGGNFSGRWTRTLKGGSDLRLEAYYDRTNRYEANFGENRDTFDVDFLVRNSVGSRQQISWGFGARASRGAAIQVTSGLTFDPLVRTDYLATIFVQDEIALVRDRLSLTLGSKVLRTNFSEIEPQPSVRLAWTPTKRQSLWGAFTRAVRTPARVERDFYLSGYIGTTPNGTPYFARFNANGGFQSEQLNGYELGYRQLMRPNLYVDIATFYNHYHDLFSEELTGPTFFETSPEPAHFLLPAQFGNGLLGTTKGYEIAPEWRPYEFWRLRGSYSYLDMQIDKAPGSRDIGTAPIVEGSSPRHEVTAQSMLDLKKGVQVDLTYRYVSALPGQNIPGYSTGDAVIAWRFRPELELAAVGRNLFQPWHVEFGNDTGPPVGIVRSAYLRLTWTK
jgi:iron complex outermembrane receptor protein